MGEKKNVGREEGREIEKQEDRERRDRGSIRARGICAP